MTQAIRIPPPAPWLAPDGRPFGAFRRHAQSPTPATVPLAADEVPMPLRPRITAAASRWLCMTLSRA